MKNKKYIILVLIFCLFFSQKTFALSSAERDQLLQKIEIIKYEITLLQSLINNMQPRQEINALSYLAVDINNNSILLERNANQIHSIASITKLMTAMIAYDNINLKNRIVLNQKMLEPWGHSPALFLGSSITAEDLIKASLIQSTNDAAEALAVFSGKDNFLNLMAQKARQIGMTNTSFHDVHGLSLNNRSNANDLAKMISYIYKEYPQILEITRDNNFWLPDPNGRMLKFRNVNGLYYINSFVGGKTGYLPQTRQNMASIFNINGRPVAIIVLNSANSQADIFTIIRKVR